MLKIEYILYAARTFYKYMNKYRERRFPLGLYWPRALLALAADNTMECNSLFVAGICYSKIKKYKSTPC